MRYLILIYFIVASSVALALDQEKFEQLKGLMVTGCALGEELNIEVEGNGDIVFFRKGVEGKIKFSKSNIPTILTQLNNSTSVGLEARNIRTCMQRYMDKIFDYELGLAKPSQPVATSKKFIGALDGQYDGTNTANGNYLTVNHQTDEFSLLVGNCSLLGTLAQQEDHWLIIATGTDGMCDMLDSAFINTAVGKIIPEKGALANSGRVLRALVNFSVSSLAPLSGMYELP